MTVPDEQPDDFAGVVDLTDEEYASFTEALAEDPRADIEREVRAKFAEENEADQADLSVPDELIDLYIATAHPGKGPIETRRASLAAFAKRHADAMAPLIRQRERQRLAEAIEDAIEEDDPAEIFYGMRKAIRIIRGDSR